MAINIDHTTDKISSDSGGDITVAPDSVTEGTIIAYKDNASSFRLRGPSSTNDPSAGIDVQSYAGMFYNPLFANTSSSGLETRVIFGANVEMDLELQAPRQLRLTAVDDSQVDGQIRMASKTNVAIHTRTDAEVEGLSHIIFDRGDQGTTGSSNTSAATLETDSGNLCIWPGRKDGDTGAIVVIKTVLDMDGSRILNLPTPIDPGDAASMDYVDTEIVALSLSGIAPPTAPVDFVGQPAVNLPVPVNVGDAAPKGYVDTEIVSLSLSGLGTLPSNPIDCNSQPLVNVADPTNPQDAATRTFVEAPHRQVLPSGGTRPSSPVLGEMFFDTTLNSSNGGLTIWNGTNWVDPSTGATV